MSESKTKEQQSPIDYYRLQLGAAQQGVAVDWQTVAANLANVIAQATQEPDGDENGDS